MEDRKPRIHFPGGKPLNPETQRTLTRLGVAAAKQLPVAPKIVAPELDTAIDKFDGSQDAGGRRLDTGMLVSEAVNRAAMWWETKGRKEMRRTHVRDRRKRRGLMDPNDPNNSIPSGVLRGQPWADLDQRSKLHIVKTWHHHFVRVSVMDPERYERLKADPSRCFYSKDRDPCGPVVADEDLPGGEVRPLCEHHFRDRYPKEAKLADEQGERDQEAEHRKGRLN